MGLKLSRNRKRVIAVTAAFIVVTAFMFQNCSPAPITDASTESTAPDTGNSLYRLPASFSETLNTGVTCSVGINSANIPSGGVLTYSISTTGTVPAGFKVYAYGSKNGVADASEIAPDVTGSLVNSYTNPGYVGGNYIRYFQIRDSAGRALCQTNSVAVTVQGPSCTLSVSATTIKVGFAAAFTTSYTAGAVVPTGGTLQFRGQNNGFEIAPIPYDSTNFTYYVRTMTNLDAGSSYLRRIVVLNTDGSIYCQTNNVRLNVIP
ncbi:hypothetical protein BH10BDE1_BH10BDE1_11340 [soil metagenome]